MLLDCSVAAQCDPTGNCKPGDNAWNFAIEPTETNDDGTGTYTVRNQGEARPASGESRTGPFFWNEAGSFRYSLTLTGETSALFVQQNLKSGQQDIETKVEFLTCEVSF